jgi:hypothetical protein
LGAGRLSADRGDAPADVPDCVSAGTDRDQGVKIENIPCRGFAPAASTPIFWRIAAAAL